MAKHRIQPVDPDPNFTEEEEKLLKHWYESGVVEKYLHKNDKSDKRFSFFDGPITANNPMGVHHGWGRTYKDLWQRYHNMKGEKLRFQNGFDCQGLWVEVEVEKELGFKSKKEIEVYGIDKFVQKCRERVLKYAAIQTEQSKRLGYFMDWDNSYFTMSDDNNYMIWHFLKVCHENGWIYKGEDSVPWCPRCETAISQHEMLTEDYKEVIHDSVYLALPITTHTNEYLLVWTTTPWTIPANIAVAVDKSIEYALVSVDGKQYWLAEGAVERVIGPSSKPIKVIPGSELVGLKYRGPFDALPAVAKVQKDNPDKFHTVVATDTLILPITTTEGTGLVHTAVSAGTEDFKLGKKLGLPMIPVINDSAYYIDGFNELSGKNAKKHPEIILDYLSSQHFAFRIEPYRHRYPACWRCKTELVWKVTNEWYVAMDKGKPSLRERMIKVAKKIHWIPEFGLDRELDWLNNMHDWLISKKNRYWGLCLPIWECSKCGHFEVIGSKAELQQKATQGWDQFQGKSPHKPQVDGIKILCSKCSAVTSRIEPVGNPWLDAGIIPFSTLKYTSDKEYWKQWFPADLITESFPGQFKNWFYSLIAMATALENTNPFKTVLGYASLLAEDGRPMHKSWGNAIEFNEGAGKIGVDIMRWLYARHNPTSNLLFGYNTATKIKRQFHLILWNSYRFFANNAAADNWQPQNKSLPKPNHILDKWIVSRFTTTTNQVAENLDHFDAFHATQAIENFVNDLSLWYIRRSRDRVGPSVTETDDKNQTYQTMRFIFTHLSLILAPLIPFIADRMFTNLTGEVSVHLANWPKLDQSLLDSKLETDMKLAREIVEKVHAQRKAANIKVRQPLEKFTVTGLLNSLSPEIQHLITQETNVKNMLFGSGKDFTVELDVTITPALKVEGEARELIRQIQTARKAAGTALSEWVTVELPTWPLEYESEIKQKTLAKKLIKGSTLQIHGETS